MRFALMMSIGPTKGRSLARRRARVSLFAVMQLAFFGDPLVRLKRTFDEVTLFATMVGQRLDDLVAAPGGRTQHTAGISHDLPDLKARSHFFSSITPIRRARPACRRTRGSREPPEATTRPTGGFWATWNVLLEWRELPWCVGRARRPIEIRDAPPACQVLLGRRRRRPPRLTKTQSPRSTGSRGSPGRPLRSHVASDGNDRSR